MNLLTSILANKKKEILFLPSDLKIKKGRRRSFADSVGKPDFSLIAETKPVSPSHGKLIDRKAVPEMVGIYSRHTSAISVLCDSKYFGGGYDLLSEVRSLTKLPLLAKDFVVDSRQIDQAAMCGADAVLLIAAILQTEKLLHLLLHAINLGLGVLLEFHAENEIMKLEKVLKKLSTKQKRHIVFGINNRDLRTGKIDLETTVRLAPVLRDRLGSSYPIISESGITGTRDIARLARYVQGFLIGTSILKAYDPEYFITELYKNLKKQQQASVLAVVRKKASTRTPHPRRGAADFKKKIITMFPKIKFCGMTRAEDIKAAERFGADFIGFVFAPSPRSVSLEAAKVLFRSVRKAKVVGVFEKFGEIGSHLRDLDLDYVQIYEDPVNGQDIGVPVIRAFRCVPDIRTLEKALEKFAFVLIDKARGKTEADFDAIEVLPDYVRSRLFLAGGLTPENLRQIAERIKPFAVDSARGIESGPGIKNPEKMFLFHHYLSL